MFLLSYFCLPLVPLPTQNIFFCELVSQMFQFLLSKGLYRKAWKQTWLTLKWLKISQLRDKRSLLKRVEESSEVKPFLISGNQTWKKWPMEESDSSWLSWNKKGKHVEGRSRHRLPKRIIETLLAFTRVKLWRPKLSEVRMCKRLHWSARGTSVSTLAAVRNLRKTQPCCVGGQGT